MRELKFRAWDKENKKMIDAESFYFSDQFEPFVESAKNAQRCFEIMQYTGLIDKNGKEICEGDVVLVEDSYTDRILDDGTGPMVDMNHVCEVIFKEGCFGANINYRGDIFWKNFYTFREIEDRIGRVNFEIIGNRFENPELLEG